MADLTVRVATVEDCRSIVDMLFEMHAEVGRAKVDLAKGLWEVDRVVRDNVAWIVEADGKLVASAGLVDYLPWYSDHRALTEQWFFVRKDWRSDGKAFRLILAEIRALCRETGMPALLTYFNPAKGGRRALSSIAEKLFIEPHGDPRPAGEVVLLDPEAI